MTTESEFGAVAPSLRGKPRRAARLAPLALLTAALHGCGDGDPESRTRTLAELPEMTASEELRIGSLDDPATALSVVGAMVVDDDGTMHVTQPQASEIRVYSGEGDLLRTFGRRGDGPGEFQGLSALGIVGDSLWVFDSRADRFSFFDPTSGDLLSDFRAPTADPRAVGGRTVTATSMVDDTTFLASALVATNWIASGEVIEMTHYLMDVEGTPVTTLPPRQLANGTWEIVVRQGGEVRGVLAYLQPFSDAQLWGLDPEGRAVITVDRLAPGTPDNAVLHVRKVGFDGDTLVARELAFDPVPITDRMVDSVLRTRIPDEGVGGVPGTAARGSALESMYRPAHLPGATLMHLGDDGRIWLESTDIDERGVAWWLLSPDGTPEATVRLPRGLRVLVTRDDLLWGTISDELGVPYVVRYRLKPASD